jgi:N-methylhydantoinase A
VSPISQVGIGRLDELLDELDAEVTDELAPTELRPEAVERHRFVQMAYAGQNFDMSVPAPASNGAGGDALMELTQRFHDQHEADRGFAFRNQEPTVRGVRITAIGHTEKPPRLAQLGTASTATETLTGTRDVWFGDGWVPTPVFAGERLGAGAELAGPALVEEPFTVVVVPPGAHLRLGEHTSYELSLAH